MLQFLRPLRRGVVQSLVLSSLAIGGTVAIPLLLGKAIDAIKSGDRSQVLPYAVAIGGAGLLRLGLSVTRRRIGGRVSLDRKYDLRNRLYAHLQSLELGFFVRLQVGLLMACATVDLQSFCFFHWYGLVFILQNLLTILL